MSVVTEARAFGDDVKERFGPTFEEIGRGVSRARRVIGEGRIAVEESAAMTRAQIRRHPLLAVAAAAGAGALVGCMAGFAWSRLCPKRT